MDNMRENDSIRIISDKIDLVELKKMAEERFGDMVKAVVNVELGIMAVGGGMHADEEALLLEKGSKQEDLWGINLYIERSKEDWIEFDSVINIRPRQNNRSRSVDDSETRKRIILIVNSFIT